MDTVDVHGTTYVKAAVAAKEVGYTPDYVGQLCRKGAIDSTLVGRTWYVREGALASHKKRKPRQSQRKIVADIEEQIEKKELERGRIHKSVYVPGFTPEYRKRLLEVPIAYESADGDLIPVPRHEQETESVSNDDTEVEEIQGVTSDEVSDAEHAEEDATFSPVAIRTLEDEHTPETDILEKNETEESDNASDLAEDNIDINDVTPHRGEASSRMALVTVGMAGVLVLSASIFLQSVWTYNKSDDPETLISTTRFQTSYAVASPAEAAGYVTKIHLNR